SCSRLFFQDSRAYSRLLPYSRCSFLPSRQASLRPAGCQGRYFVWRSGMATFVTSFLVLMLGQTPAPSEPDYHNTFRHRIPFNILERRSEIREVRLYVSSDEGTSWQAYANVAPEKSEFRFQGPTD